MDSPGYLEVPDHGLPDKARVEGAEAQRALRILLPDPHLGPGHEVVLADLGVVLPRLQPARARAHVRARVRTRARARARVCGWAQAPTVEEGLAHSVDAALRQVLLDAVAVGVLRGQVLLLQGLRLVECRVAVAQIGDTSLLHRALHLLSDIAQVRAYDDRA